MRHTSAAVRNRCARLQETSAGSEQAAGVGGTADLFIYISSKCDGVADTEARAPPLTAAAQSFQGVNTFPRLTTLPFRLILNVHGGKKINLSLPLTTRFPRDT